MDTIFLKNNEIKMKNMAQTIKLGNNAFFTGKYIKSYQTYYSVRFVWGKTAPRGYMSGLYASRLKHDADKRKRADLVNGAGYSNKTW